MKKIFAIVMSAVSILAIGTMAACGETATTYTGEYHYGNAWAPTAPDYGVKVNVEVTGNKITNVTIAESEWTQVSESWKDTDEAQAYLNGGEAALLASFVGKTVAEVNAYTVTTTVSGEYHYGNAWAPTAPDYGVKVNVSVANGKITNVAIAESEWTQVSESWKDTDEAQAYLNGGEAALLASFVGKTPAEVNAYSVTSTLSGEYHYANPWAPEAPDYGVKVNVVISNGKIVNVTVADHEYTQVSDSWTETDEAQAYLNGGEAALLASFAGKTVAEVLAYDVDTADNGQPNSVTAEGLALVSGATQSCGRLVLAVQNALAGAATAAPGAITAEGLTLSAGATQSCGRIILAVQNAMTKLATAAPSSIAAEGLTLSTGATQSCGRIVLAVQNALAQIK